MDSVYIGIDPGTSESGIVALFPDNRVISPLVLENGEVLKECSRIVHRAATEYPCGIPIRVGVEMIASYGMPVGKEVFETILWIGHFISQFPSLASPVSVKKVYRINVKSHICKSGKAKDANIRQAILDLFPGDGGGKTPQIGTKAEPGPLYGVKSHIWAALGVAITARDTWDNLEAFGMISDPLQTHFSIQKQ